MPLSLPKSQCLHFSRKNIKHVCSLGAAAVSVVNQCTDLGLLRTSDFLYAEHIRSIVDKALRCSGMLLRAFSSRQCAFMLKLFVTYVRPIVKYASSVRNPTQVGLRREVEYVQRRFTKKMRNLQYFSFEERCKRLHLATLEHRRHQADLIVAFKMLQGELDIDAGSIGVVWPQAPTRGCGANLLVRRAANNVIGKSYCFRIARLWNSLPAPAKRAQSLSVFKKLIA